ncbi:MAG: head GIN domain-containing protein [Bacteroidota bacterium]
MVQKNIFFTGLILLVILNSCIDIDYFPCVKPDGNLVEELRPVESIGMVNVKMNAEVQIYYAETDSLIIEAPLNILDFIETENRAGHLHIQSTRCIRNQHDEIIVHVFTSSLPAIKLSGSGNVYFVDVFEAEYGEFEITGSGDVYFEGNCEVVKSRITGSGSVILDGICTRHDAEIAGSGDLDASNLFSEYTHVKITGSGHANLFVEKELTVKLLGSGNVYYGGEPDVFASVTGSGNVYHWNE